MLNDYILKREAEFDEKFGKAGPEKNSDSIGRKAGCDDCAENIELREEHKSFHAETIRGVMEVLAREIDNLEKRAYLFESRNNDEIAAYYRALRDVRNLLNPKDI